MKTISTFRINMIFDRIHNLFIISKIILINVKVDKLGNNIDIIVEFGNFYINYTSFFQ